jgi:hypothetical protein
MSAMISDDSGERWQAYTESQIRIWHPGGVLVVRPEARGTVVGEFPEASGATIHVVTAHNPGRQLSDAENAVRHQWLEQRLGQVAGLTVWPAEGGDVLWRHRERSLALVGLADADVRALGVEFDQEAVFAWRPHELGLLECASEGSVSSGWSLVLLP